MTFINKMTQTSAYILVPKVTSIDAFELKTIELEEPNSGMVTIEIEAFGLNYADVMARKGKYQGAPPRPCTIGYEVVGKVIKTGVDVDQNLLGKRVVAFTRFGGYAKHCNTWDYAVIPVGDEPAGELLALATQGVTAFYMSQYLTPIREGDHVLIHAAAGGVGTILIQLSKLAGAIVYAKVGNDSKLDYVKSLGADYGINYKKADYSTQILKLNPNRKLDVSFNPAAGSTFKKDMKLIGSGGRVILFGASELTSGKWGFLSTLNFVRKMGLLIPALLMQNSKSIIGVNMLEIADQNPEILKRCLHGVVELYRSGKLKPQVGKIYDNGDVYSAHSDMESGQTVGKLVVRW